MRRCLAYSGTKGPHGLLHRPQSGAGSRCTWRSLTAAAHGVGSSIHPDCGAQEAAIRAGDLDALCAAAGNALEECSGAKDTGAIKALLREHGAVTALMTGSGAAVFGVFRDEGAARAAAQAAKRRWKQVYVAQPDRGGARVSR